MATKRGGLLVDPIELAERPASKVAPEAVLAAIASQPGQTYRQLAAKLGVSRATAMRYVDALGDVIVVDRGSNRVSSKLFASASAVQSGSHAREQLLEHLRSVKGAALPLNSPPTYKGGQLIDEEEPATLAIDRGATRELWG